MGIVEVKVHFLESEGAEVHNVTDVEVEDPVFKSFHSKKGFDILAEVWDFVWGSLRGDRAHPGFIGLLNAG